MIAIYSALSLEDWLKLGSAGIVTYFLIISVKFFTYEEVKQFINGRVKISLKLVVKIFLRLV